MSYYIDGISYETFKALHDFYLPRTVITSSYWSNQEQSYQLSITTNALLKINDGDITIDLAGKLFTIPSTNYYQIFVSNIIFRKQNKM